MKLETMLNDALRRAGLAHRAVYRPPADASVDGELAIMLAGAASRFSVQVGASYLCIGEYEFESGEISALVHHGDFRRADAARCFRRVAEILQSAAAEPPR